MAIRSFLAFEIPSEIRHILSTASEDGQAALKDIRWVRVTNIHLTVVFMGNVEEAVVGKIKDAAKKTCAQYEPFSIRVKGAGLFGGRRNPRVLWMGLEGDLDRMSGFRQDLQTGLIPFGIQAEDRPFRPHLTLGRFRKGARMGPALDGFLSKYREVESPEGILRELVLFRSNLKPGGAVYAKLGAWPLGKQ